jgi:hypothetical protein
MVNNKEITIQIIKKTMLTLSMAQVRGLHVWKFK